MSVDDRPDFAGSLGNRHYDPATYSNSMADRPDYAASMKPLDKNGRDFDSISNDLYRQLIGNQTTLYAQKISPIKVFTVCVDQMSGKYMAFLGSDPAQRVTGDSRLEAVALLLAHTKTIVMTEID